MKVKYCLIAILCVVMVLSLALTACNQEEAEHVCESKCPICRLCTNLDCQEDACRRKCHGHTTTSDDPEHVHEFSEEWSSDDEYHWHAATCEHNEKKDYAKHTLDGNGFCSVCQKQVYSFEGNFQVFSMQGNANDAVTMPEAPTYTKGSLVIHYRRTNSEDYKHWGFWIWIPPRDGMRYAIRYQDEFGGVAVLEPNLFEKNSTIGLIPINDVDPPGDAEWYTKDLAGADRYFTPSDFEQQDGCYHLYIIESDISTYKTIEETDYQSLNYAIKAKFTERGAMDITFATPVTNLAVYEGETKIGELAQKAAHVKYTLDHDADLKKHYFVKATFEQDGYQGEAGVDISAFYGLAEFDETFYYEGDDLGAVLGPNSTTFKVWSPVSNKMVLNLYNEGDGGDPYETHEMTLGDYGVWEYTANTRLAGKYYTYTVYNASNPKGMEVCDPYAKSAGLNGVRGMVVNFNAGLATPDNWDNVEPLPYDANELVVWETHVADVTASATWGGPANLAKTFLGMAQSGTTYTQGGTTVKTGFDHIAELGVNAVQILPIFDQTNLEEANLRSFNWGYNPLNYNVLEGSYSTNPNDGYARIREFRQLVQAFNSKGINIIMDVVYNHVSDAGNSNFEILMPGYYFRHNPDGSMNNDSHCGNVVMSERPMMRKFIIDSVCFWTREYKLGGFRFDIMGLHDLETMNKLVAAVRTINPSAVFYGEAWNNNSIAGLQVAEQSNAYRFPSGLAQFNDRMRDQIINFAAGKEESSTRQRITDGFYGKTTEITDDAYKTLNYVSCHDNYTVKDNFVLNKNVSSNVKQRAMLSNAMVLTSNGITFMLAGEEFLRSKKDLGATNTQANNSYNAPYEVNALDYSLKITNADMFANYQKLIAFKKMFVDDFGLNSKSNILNTAKYKVGFDKGVYYIDICATNGAHWVVAHAGPSGSGTLSGSSVYLSTTGNNSSTLQPYETKIVRI